MLGQNDNIVEPSQYNSSNHLENILELKISGKTAAPLCSNEALCAIGINTHHLNDQLEIQYLSEKISFNIMNSCMQSVI
jgi:hypothetical protein